MSARRDVRVSHVRRPCGRPSGWRGQAQQGPLCRPGREICRGARAPVADPGRAAALASSGARGRYFTPCGPHQPIQSRGIRPCVKPWWLARERARPQRASPLAYSARGAHRAGQAGEAALHRPGGQGGHERDAHRVRRRLRGAPARGGRRQAGQAVAAQAPDLLAVPQRKDEGAPARSPRPAWQGPRAVCAALWSNSSISASSCPYGGPPMPAALLAFGAPRAGYGADGVHACTGSTNGGVPRARRSWRCWTCAARA